MLAKGLTPLNGHTSTKLGILAKFMEVPIKNAENKSSTLLADRLRCLGESDKITVENIREKIRVKRSEIEQ